MIGAYGNVCAVHASGRGFGLMVGMGSMLAYGTAFLVPETLPTVSAVEITMGRYVVYGALSAVLLLTTARGRWRRFGRGVWGTALLLGLTGNVGYYLLVVLAVQRAGAPLTALVVGALPVTLAVAGTRGSAGRLRALVPALVLTLAGLTLVNISALTRAQDPGRSPAWGLATAVAALASWTWFGLGNARFLDAHPDIGPMLWASVLGIAGLAWTLPVIAVLLFTGRTVTATNQPAGYLAGVLLLGILTSWVAAAAWNRAATALPVALAGQLVVIETVAGTTYSYLYHHAWPEPAVLAGLALLVAGVSLAVRRTNPQPEETNAPSTAASTQDR
jgi:drug/metabolite transporter (DMT)-like permease